MNAQVKEQWIDPPAPPPTISVGEIAAAFAKAQLEMHNPKFDSANPFFKSKFASLAAVRNAVIPCFAKHGICVAQDLVTAEGTISCSTILTHSSGQQMRFGPLTLPVTKADAQGYAAAGTYAKRIALQSVAAVVGDEDNDGNEQIPEKPERVGHDPKGDMGKSVNPQAARETAKRMMDLMDGEIIGDHEDAKKAAIVLDFHEQVLNPDPDLYVAVGEVLAAPKRNAWKGYVALAKKLEAAEPKGVKF